MAPPASYSTKRARALLPAVAKVPKVLSLLYSHSKCGIISRKAAQDDDEAEMMEGVCDPEFGIGTKGSGTRLN